MVVEGGGCDGGKGEGVMVMADGGDGGGDC